TMDAAAVVDHAPHKQVAAEYGHRDDTAAHPAFERFPRGAVPACNVGHIHNTDHGEVPTGNQTYVINAERSHALTPGRAASHVIPARAVATGDVARAC